MNQNHFSVPSRAAKTQLLFLASIFSLFSIRCTSTTGNEIYRFQAYASGSEDLRKDTSFQTETGWTVTLRKAVVTLGPIYLNTIAPLQAASPSFIERIYPSHLPWTIKAAYASGESHLGNGRIVGEVLSQVKFDALSPERVAFPSFGTVSSEKVQSTDISFYPAPGEALDSEKITSIALDVEGIATKNQENIPFSGKLILNDDWTNDLNSGAKGSESLLSIRQVRGVASSILPTPDGRLVLKIHVPALFRGANFSALYKNPKSSDGVYQLVQAKEGSFLTDQVMRNLYQGLRSSKGTYTLFWEQNPSN